MVLTIKDHLVTTLLSAFTNSLNDTYTIKISETPYINGIEIFLYCKPTKHECIGDKKEVMDFLNSTPDVKIETEENNKTFASYLILTQVP